MTGNWNWSVVTAIKLVHFKKRTFYQFRTHSLSNFSYSTPTKTNTKYYSTENKTYAKKVQRTRPSQKSAWVYLPSLSLSLSLSLGVRGLNAYNFRMMITGWWLLRAFACPVRAAPKRKRRSAYKASLRGPARNRAGITEDSLAAQFCARRVEEVRERFALGSYDWIFQGNNRSGWWLLSVVRCFLGGTSGWAVNWLFSHDLWISLFIR